jgi:alpha-1,2-mannosyltransferase
MGPSEDYPSAYVQPPWLAAVMSPIAAGLSFQAFSTIFLVVNTTALFAGTIIAYNYFTSRDRPMLLIDKQNAIVALALIPASPFIALMFYNQTQCLVILSLLCALIYGRRAPIASGAFLGLSIAMKISPIVFVVYLGFSRRWKAAAAALAVAAMIGLLDLALIERSLNAQFVSNLSIMGHSLYTGSTNYSPVKLVYYLFDREAYAAVIPDHTDAMRVPQILSPILMTVAMVFLAVDGIASRRSRDDTRLYDALALIATVPVALIAWNHYYAIVLFAAFAILSDRTPARISLYAGIAILIGVGLYLFDDKKGVLRASLANLGMMITFGTLAVMAFRQRGQRVATRLEHDPGPGGGTGFSTDTVPNIREAGTV